MHNKQIDLINKLNSERQSYAKATVVRRQLPSSGKPGDSAIILPNGSMHGWVGGGCTRGIVLKEALQAISEGRSRFVRISTELVPDAMPNTKQYTMTCQSGGSVELFIEPVLPRPQIVIFGQSHIGIALAKISLAMDYRVIVVHDDADRSTYGDLTLQVVSTYGQEDVTQNSYLVVCTQGQGDEKALKMAIDTGNDYVAFVSSRKKAHAIFSTLRSQGVSFDQLKKIRTPAGLDIHAKLPEEVAISILGQIIEDIRKPEPVTSEAAKPHVNLEEYYINPVCNIPIHKATAKHVLQYKDHSVYFCCDGCKVKFEENPEQYIDN
ncbi:MAG: YHS domain-containing protein [Saprospiraceae bacterium]|nr:YHS domain-containing protein [Saprospiraceae bacterium]